MKGDDIVCHLEDILRECGGGNPDLAQIKHNVWEIAEHCGVSGLITMGDIANYGVEE